MTTSSNKMPPLTALLVLLVSVAQKDAADSSAAWQLPGSKQWLLHGNSTSLYIPDTPWDCHICRPIDPQSTTPTDRHTYGIHGVSGYCSQSNICVDLRSTSVTGRLFFFARAQRRHRKSRPETCVVSERTTPVETCGVPGPFRLERVGHRWQGLKTLFKGDPAQRLAQCKAFFGQVWWGRGRRSLVEMGESVEGGAGRRTFGKHGSGGDSSL